MSVQASLMKLDSLVGLEAVELPCAHWKGLSSVDVAVRGSSEVFVEHCCGLTIAPSLCGDCVSVGGVLRPRVGFGIRLRHCVWRAAAVIALYPLSPRGLRHPISVLLARE